MNEWINVDVFDVLCMLAQWSHTGYKHGDKLGYIVGFGLVEMAISINPRPTI